MVESASQMVYRLVDRILQGNQLALVCCIILISVLYFRDSRIMVTSMKLAQFIL